MALNQQWAGWTATRKVHSLTHSILSY